VAASALMRSAGSRRPLRGDGVGVRGHCLSHRRQVDVARVTRRSHSGHVADISRLAFVQNANVEAGIGPRQYTHGTLSAS
jgi:hypothetical protein